MQSARLGVGRVYIRQVGMHLCEQAQTTVEARAGTKCVETSKGA